MCVWVPPECCLIPLPASPENLSEEEEEEDEKKMKGKVLGGGQVGRKGIRRVLSESELQIQCEKELEDLLGFKPPPPPRPSSLEQELPLCPPSSSSSSQIEANNSSNNREDPICKEAGRVKVCTNKRSNSTDSGVSDISPRSMESDLEQRQSGIGMRLGDKGMSSMECRGRDKGRLGDRAMKQLPVSKLRTPSEKLRNCSVFSASVSSAVCREEEGGKEI